MRAFRPLGAGYTEYLKRQPIRFALRAAVSGSNGLREGPLDKGCTMICFEQRVDLRYMARQGNAQVERDELTGHDIICMHTDAASERQPATYFCRPRDDVLVAATDAALLRSLLRRQIQKPELRALPANLDEWKYVNASAPVWGLRHLADLRDDQEANERGAMPVGFTFSFDSGPDSAIIVHCLVHKGNEATERGLSDFMREIGNQQPPRFVAPRVAEITLSADSSSDFITEGLMGYRVGL